jgi:diguanylate cyclase (GGDEF)-like protein
MTSLINSMQNQTDANSLQLSGQEEPFDIGRMVRLFVRQQANFEIIMACMTQGVALYDADERLVFSNRRYMEIHGLKDELATPGTSFLEMLRYRIEEGSYPDVPPEQYVSEMVAIVKSGVQHKSVQHLRNGFTISYGYIPLDDGGWISTHEDVSEIYTLQREVQHMAFHDQLTGLPNRRMLASRLEEANNNCTSNKGFALLFLDLDGFKPVNDRFGHSAGDKLLCMVADRLRGCARADDTVARLGGDEFAILQCSAKGIASAEVLAHRVLEALEKPFEIDPAEVRVSTSIGIVFTPYAVQDVEALLIDADKAMYFAKNKGGRRFQVATPSSDRRSAA